MTLTWTLPTEEEVAPTDRPSVYPELDINTGQERYVYRASSLHSCHNALIQARLGVTPKPPPGWMQRRYDAGHDWEPRILEHLRTAYEFNLYGFQETVEMKIGSSALVRGHVDALASAGRFRVHSVDGILFDNPDGEWITVDDIVVVDAKALAQSGYNRWCAKQWDEFPYYLWQQAFYVHGLDAAGVVMAVKNKGIVGDDGHPLADPNEYSVDYFTAKNLSVRKGDIIKRVREIEKMADAGPYATPCPEPLMYPCPYWPSHEVKEAKKVVKGRALSAPSSQIDLYAAEYTAAMGREKQAAADKEQAAVQIRALHRAEAAESQSANWKLTTYYAKYSGADWEAIGAALKMSADDAQAKFTRQMESPKLSVRVGAVK